MQPTDQDRITGRLWAEGALDGLEDESPDFAEGFWRAIRRHLPKPSPATLGAMSDELARAFGNTRITFGKHEGEHYDDIPLDYLEWLNDVSAERARYLASRRIQAEAVDD